MNLKTKILLSLVSPIGIVYGCCEYISTDIAANTIVSERISPDNNYKAIVFDRNAGATTGFTTQVSIIKNKDKLHNEPGNIYISDTNHGEAASASWGGPRINLYWANNNNLIIEKDNNSRIFKAETQYRGIYITYKHLCGV